MKQRMPLSKSASAFHLISRPLLSLGRHLHVVGAGGGVVSLTAPVLTYSIQALATASFGSQTASFGLPWYEAAGTAWSPSSGASQAWLCPPA